MAVPTQAAEKAQPFRAPLGQEVQPATGHTWEAEAARKTKGSRSPPARATPSLAPGPAGEGPALFTPCV